MAADGAPAGAVAAGDAATARVRDSFRRYRRPPVRDLAWLAFDGALQLPRGNGSLATVALDPEERAELLDLLAQWDEDDQDRWVGPVDPNLRLGLYAEHLIGAWLAHSRRIRLLARNWPLRSSRITLGEADLLVQRLGEGRGNPDSLQEGQGQDRPGQADGGAGGLQLWELACKFYLGMPGGGGWIGPGLNDSLATKLARMRKHQLQLIHQPGFKDAWQGNWTALAWLTGWLLLPAQEAAADPPDRIPAIWAEASDASLAPAQAIAAALAVEQWWLLPKRRWLRPAHGDEPTAQVFASLEAAAAFISGPAAPRQRGTSQPRPLMLAGVRRVSPGDPDAAAGTQPAVAIEEMLRLMLVPAGWSARAAAIPALAQ